MLALWLYRAVSSSGPGIDLIRVPRRERAPLAAVARRVSLAVGLVFFIAVVTWLNGDGYVDGNGDGVSFLDALYYASVTVTTTGYGDITAISDTARLATIALITPARIVFLILVVGTTVEVLTDQSREFLASRRWRRRVRNHILICGFGSTGQSAAAELRRRGVTADRLAVVDLDTTALTAATRLGYVAIEGDATRSTILAAAGVEEAESVIVAPNRDDTAVLVTLTVRELNPTVHLVAAGREQENLHLLRQGGADEVIDATAAVGRMIGLATSDPGAVSVIDDLLEAGTGFDLSELPLQRNSAGQPVVPEGSTIVAVIRDGQQLRPSEVDTANLRDTDRLIVLTEPK